MSSTTKRILFLMFFLSGWCGLAYQIIWARMAFAAFGIITPVLSVVISVFMLGLFVGSWAGGKWVEALVSKTGVSAIALYGITELCIGLGAFIVPRVFSSGADYLLPLGSMNDQRYLLLSAAVIAVSILPWCICMGATFPFMMAFVRKSGESGTFQATSFSYLYQANVIGALCGTAMTALIFVESFGFSTTLLISAFFNFAIAFMAFGLSRRPPLPAVPPIAQDQPTAGLQTEGGGAQEDSEQSSLWASSPMVYIVLFMTGFISMAMEVVWTRAFTPVLTTTIYAFAALLAVYCLATWAGAFMYRRHIKKNLTLPVAKLLTWLALFSCLPVALNDPRISSNVFITLLSIVPLCAALGYLTPKLIDLYSYGSPRSAGRVYAVNILGCIVGPLFAGYLLLPFLGVRFSLVLLALPFLLFPAANMISKKAPGHVVPGVLSLILLFVSVFVNVTYEDGDPGVKHEVRRDYTATVISSGEGMQKKLLINGIGITVLTPITKFMAHLPMAFQASKPSSALAICFGMGTTYRSLLSWDVDVTAVELVPSVKDAFGYYYSDAQALLGHPKGRVVIDDGRRFLHRTAEKYDVITIDPPPPVEAAGSSLLYSLEFYEEVREHLSDGGIMQQWFPGGEEKILIAVMNSLARAFPHIRMYRSIDGWGFHFLASMSPIEPPTAEEMLARMPEGALADLVEWYPGVSPAEVISAVLGRQMAFDRDFLTGRDMIITDDRPFNEYYFLRRLQDRLYGTESYVQ